MESKGRIFEIKRETVHRYVQGITGGHGYERTMFGYYNGYGAFCQYPETYITLTGYVYKTKKVISIDIKDAILEHTGRQRISAKLLNQLNEQNGGRKITFHSYGDDDWNIDIDDLIF